MAADRHENDAYYTDPRLVRAGIRAALIDGLIVPRASTSGLPPLRIVEPSVGIGRFVEGIRELVPYSLVTGVDIDPNAPGLAMCDRHVVGDWPTIARNVAEAAGPDAFDLVIGNPPYAKPTGRFNDKGKEILEPCAIEHVEASLSVAPVVCMLLRLTLVIDRGRQEFWRKHPGHSMRGLAERPKFREGGGTDSNGSAWFMWSRWYDGPMQLTPCWSWDA